MCNAHNHGPNCNCGYGGKQSWVQRGKTSSNQSSVFKGLFEAQESEKRVKLTPEEREALVKRMKEGIPD